MEARSPATQGRPAPERTADLPAQRGREGPFGRPPSVPFGRYTVVCPIGEGGTADVFLAVRRGVGGFEKRVVLKVLQARFLGHPGAVEMFLEEARLLARLSHPNIVEVFDVERHGDVPYLVMGYVNGPTLGQLQRHVGRPGPDTIGVFLQLMRQVCDGLHHAHTLQVDGRPAGMIHRDVSSQNVVVDAGTGLAKLIDFGIAKAVDSDKHTELGILKGRLHYMAPEVLGGARPDARADLYAVGVMLHRIAIGRMPFRDQELGARRLAVPTDGPEWAALPQGLAPILVRALSPRPEDRPASAGELSAELEAVCARLGASQADVAPLVARVFPGGEADWRRQLDPAAITQHSSLHRLSSAPAPERAAPDGDPDGSDRADGQFYRTVLLASVMVALAALLSASLVVGVLVAEVWGTG